MVTYSTQLGFVLEICARGWLYILNGVSCNMNKMFQPVGFFKQPLHVSLLELGPESNEATPKNSSQLFC